MKTLTLFRIYQLAGRNMKYALRCRHCIAHKSSFGILANRDQYALEYQLWNKVRDQAEALLIKHLEGIK